MDNSKIYFELARNEEKIGHFSSALLFYLSSFCESFNSSNFQYPYQATEKIRRLQFQLSLTDEELIGMIRSYGPLTDPECRHLLISCIYGNLSAIQYILAESGVSYEH